jgi:hypothetical protein
MQSDKATLKEAQDGIKSKKLNDHRGKWRLCKSLTCVSMRQVNPNKSIKEKTKIMLPNNKNKGFLFSCPHVISCTQFSPAT